MARKWSEKERKAYFKVLYKLYVHKNLSIKEVAAALQKTEGAIKLVQHRALKELKLLLQ